MSFCLQVYNPKFLSILYVALGCVLSQLAPNILHCWRRWFRSTLYLRRFHCHHVDLNRERAAAGVAVSIWLLWVSRHNHQGLGSRLEPPYVKGH